MGKLIRGLEAGKRPALVISECQRGVLDPSLAIFPGLAEESAARGTLDHIAELANAFRQRQLPVLHAHVVFRADFGGAAITNPIVARSAKEGRMAEGTPQVESMPAVAPLPQDFVNRRRSGLAMWYGTDIDATLRNSGVKTIVLTGVSTNVAIFGGSLGAIDRGYQVVLPEDAIAGASAESHQWMLTNTLPLLASISTTKAVIEALDA